MYKYKATGKVRYGRHQKDGGEGWVVLDCPYDIVYYYNKVAQWLLWNNHITIPMHGSHITVIAGKYDEVDYDTWGYRDGEEIEFSYGATQNGGNYYWLPVECVGAEDIRTFYGLEPTPLYQYHLTVGYNNQ